MSNRTGAGATVNPDNIHMFYATTIGVGLVFAASVTISSFGLYAIGLAQGLPPHVAWATPLMIDVSILVFTMVALIQKRRGNTFARVFASAGVGLATMMSMGLNFLHSYFEIGVEDLQSAAGTLVNTMAPLFIWVTTEMLVLLVTKQAPAAVPREVPVAAAPKPAPSPRKSRPRPPRTASAEGERPAQSRPATPAKPAPPMASPAGDEGPTSAPAETPPVPSPTPEPARVPVAASQRPTPPPAARPAHGPGQPLLPLPISRGEPVAASRN